jgi:hypothetical protein
LLALETNTQSVVYTDSLGVPTNNLNLRMAAQSFSRAAAQISLSVRLMIEMLVTYSDISGFR